jgi:hypothetical protein
MRNSKRDPFLIFFDSIFLLRQLPGYNTIVTLLVNNYQILTRVFLDRNDLHIQRLGI